jgi:hypothetical protein
LHIDELQSDLHTTGSREGYQLPEKLRIEQNNKIEEVLEGSGMSLNPLSPAQQKTKKIYDAIRLRRDAIYLPNGRSSIMLSDIPLIAKGLRAGQAGRFNLRFDDVPFDLNANSLVESLGYDVEKIYELALDLVKPLTEAGPVPDYPYKDNWHEMVLKNLLLDAAREGKPACLRFQHSAPH